MDQVIRVMYWLVSNFCVGNDTRFLNCQLSIRGLVWIGKFYSLRIKLCQPIHANGLAWMDLNPNWSNLHIQLCFLKASIFWTPKKERDRKERFKCNSFLLITCQIKIIIRYLQLWFYENKKNDDISIQSSPAAHHYCEIRISLSACYTVCLMAMSNDWDCRKSVHYMQTSSIQAIQRATSPIP